MDDIMKWMRKNSIICNLDIKTIIKHYFNYMIKNHPNYIIPSFLNIVENIVHNYDTNVEYILFYFINHIKEQYNIINNNNN
jgi:hypothetical protein